MAGLGGPHEGLGVCVPVRHAVFDGRLELLDTGEDAAADALTCDLREQPLNQIEPGAGGRVLTKQCLDRRIPDKQTLIEEIAAWQLDRKRQPHQSRLAILNRKCWR